LVAFDGIENTLFHAILGLCVGLGNFERAISGGNDEPLVAVLVTDEVARWLLC
jgi:hypothetical protein